jgi:hypothetical protein
MKRLELHDPNNKNYCFFTKWVILEGITYSGIKPVNEFIIPLRTLIQQGFHQFLVP